MVSISNGESGASVRSKINTLFTDFANRGAKEVADLATLQADTTLTYTTGQDGTVAAGDIVRTRKEGFAYEVLASGASGDITNSNGTPVQLRALPGPDGVYNSRAWGEAADGSTNDAAVYAKIAATVPAGSTLRISENGVRVIGSTITFAQDDLTIICDKGATFKQANSTQTIDTLIKMTGTRPKWIGGQFDANTANNGTYTGRGELLRLEGDALRTDDTENVAVVDGAHIISSHDVTTGAGIFVRTATAFVRGITGDSTGGFFVRLHTDHAVVAEMSLDDISGSSNAGIGQDSAFTSGVAFKSLVIENSVLKYSGTSAQELILVDDSTYTGGEVTVRNCQILAPNMTANDNVFKFVNCNPTLENVRTERAQGAGDSVCLRLQGDTPKVRISGCSFAGMINFDGTDEIDLLIDKGTVIGRDLTASYAIQQFPGGTITLEDGVSLKGYGTAAILTSSTALGRAATINAGSLRLEGTASSTAVFASYTWTDTERPTAGQIRIKAPLSITGQRTREANENWVLPSIRNEPVVLQDGLHLCDRGSGDFAQMTAAGPERIFGWTRGAKLMAAHPSSGDSEAIRICTTAGISAFDWAISTAYVAGDYVGNGGNAYVCTTGGTSAGAGGPTGTGTGITDGTVTWDYAGTHAQFGLSA